MSKPLKLNGDVMAETVQLLLDENMLALRMAAQHIQAKYSEPIDYQAALGELTTSMLDQRRLIKTIHDIVMANNKKKNRSHSSKQS